MYWRRNSLFERPATAQPIAQGVIGRTKTLSPFGQSKRFSVDSDQMVHTSISALLLLRSPTAVSRLIVSALVRIAVKFQSLRAFAHVGKKVLEAVSPSIANPNPSTTVEVEPLRAAVVAAPLSIHPRLVGARPKFLTTILSSVTMNDPALSVEASATNSMPAPEILTDHNGHIAAIAQATPKCATILRAIKCHNRQSPESLSTYIFEIMSAAAMLLISHFDLLFRSVVRVVGELALVGDLFFYTSILQQRKA